MELREYWGILARRRGWIVAVTVLAFLASAAMVMAGPNSYKAELRLVISVKPEPRVGDYYTYDKYYSWLTSEYLVDDFGEVVKSSAFAQDVSARLGNAVPADAIKRDTRTTKTHRVLTVTVTTGTPALSESIARAMKETMETKASDYFVGLGTGEAMLRVIDGPSVESEMGTVRRALEIALRTLVGAIAAVALAFLLHYLDTTVRTRAEAESLLGLPVIGEIPR